VKGFFLAAFASFVGGVLVLLFQTYVSLEGPKDRPQTVSVTGETNAIKLTKSDVEKMHGWYLSFPDYLRELHRDDNIELAYYVIENIGKRDIEDFSMDFSSKIDNNPNVFLTAKFSDPVASDEDSDALAFSIRNEPEHWNEITIQDRKSFHFEIPLLKSYEKIMVISAVLPNNSLKYSIRTKDVKIKNSQSDFLLESEWEVLKSLGYFAIGLAIFLFGIGISEYYHREVFRKVGFEYDEMMRLYKESEKKND
jgi:hypothetical protein